MEQKTVSTLEQEIEKAIHQIEFLGPRGEMLRKLSRFAAARRF